MCFVVKCRVSLCKVVRCDLWKKFLCVVFVWLFR